MKTPIPSGTMAGFLAAALACVLTSNSASAQTTYNATLDNEVELIYGAINPNTSPHYDAINFATGNGTKLDVDQNVSFSGSTLANVFTSTTFTSTGGRVSASMVGIDEFFTPVDGRTFIVQNFALDNVDFTTSNSTTGDVELRIQGPGGLNTSLTLVNSSLSCAISPHLYAPSAFTFNVSGTSQIDGWSGHMSSATVLTVASGGSLRIKDCGSLTATVPQQKLYFDQYSNSAVVFGANPYGDPSKESTMTFSNNATLQITGLNPYASLETDNLVFQNSSLNVATNNSRLKLRNNLELDNSSATIANGAQADTFGVIAKGNATVSLGLNGRFNTSKVDIRDGATMTITGSSYDIGEMTVSSQVLFPSSGTGNLVLSNSQAVLNLTSGATMDVTSHAALTNNGSINLQEAKMTVRQGASVTNNMELIVLGNSTLSITGDATIGQASGQHGVMTIGGNITFIDSSSPGNNSLSTTNQVDLGSTSNLHMTLDPTGLTSDRLLIDNSAREFTINNSATLSLNVANDAALVIGTKFLLINYPDWQVAMGAHFNGLVDGATFALGLNTYQINYNDGAYIPAQGSTFITLTTVPEPGTLALLGLGAIALAGRALRRR
jgi:hypothetical protein